MKHAAHFDSFSMKIILTYFLKIVYDLNIFFFFKGSFFESSSKASIFIAYTPELGKLNNVMIDLILLLLFMRDRPEKK